MKSEDLRIGNWYHSVKFNIPVKCSQEDFYNLVLLADGSSIDYYIDSLFKPIPLTKEWLLKLGLHHNVNYFKGLGIYLDKGVAYFTDNEYGHKKDDEISVKFVHQLQNLYFALTGEELNTDL